MSDRTALPLTALLLCALGVPSGARTQTPPGGTLTLHRAVELALARAPQVAVASAAREVTEADLRLAGDSFHPEAELSTTPGVARGLPVAVFGRVPAIVGVSGHQTLYDPARRYELLETEARAAQGRAQSEMARREAARAAALLYVRCWADQAKVQAAARRELALGRSLARVQVQEREGRVIGLAVEEVRLRAERARLGRLGNESELDLDRLELARLTSAPVGALALADPEQELPAAAAAADDLQAARAADPELRADTEALDLLGRGAGLRQRRLAPTVEAVAQYYRLDAASFGRFYRRFRADDWSLAVSFALPLWTGGRAADGLARTQATVAQKSAEKLARQSELDLAMRRAEAARDRARAAASLARQGETLAAEDLRVTRALAAEGRTGEDEVDAKESALAAALEESAQAARDLLATRIDLLALRGELLDALAPSGGKPEPVPAGGVSPPAATPAQAALGPGGI